MKCDLTSRFLGQWCGAVRTLALGCHGLASHPLLESGLADQNGGDTPGVHPLGAAGTC